MLNYKILYIIGILFVISAGIVLSAPPPETGNVTRDLTPETTDTYFIGKPDRTYLNGYFQNLFASTTGQFADLRVYGNSLIGGNATTTGSTNVGASRCFDGVDCIDAWGEIEADDAINETPSGTINGSNKVFTLSTAPNDDDSVIITANGQVQRNGIDVTTSGVTITFTDAPETGWTIFAHYNKTSSIFQPGLNNSIRTVTADDTITNNDGTILCDSTSGVVTLTLPASLGINSQEFVIIKVNSGANKCTLDGNGSETINGVTTLDITSQNDSAHIKSTNSSATNWNII